MCHVACLVIRNLTGHPWLAVDHNSQAGQRPMSSNFCGARRTGEESPLAAAWSTLPASDSCSGVSVVWRFLSCVVQSSLDTDSLRMHGADTSGVLNRFCQQLGVCRNERAALSGCCFPNS